MSEKRLLTLRDFSERYSISRASIYRQVSDGRLRLTKLGTRSLVDVEDAEAWLAALPRSSNSP